MHTRQLPAVIIVSIVITIIAIITLLGNLLVIGAVMTSQRLRDQQNNWLVVNLAVSDLSTMALVMTTSVYSLISDLLVINAVWCNIVCTVNYCLIITSMLTLCVISIERFYAVYRPLRYHAMFTNKVVFIACCYTWFQGLLFSVIPVACGWVHYDYWEMMCSINWSLENKKKLYYVLAAFIANFGIPGFLILTSYACIMKSVRAIRRPTAASIATSSTNSSNIMTMETRRTVRTMSSLLVVILVFFICISPFCVTKLLKIIYAAANAHFVHEYASLGATVLQFLACMVNPFIYAIFRADFRREFRQIGRRIGLPVKYRIGIEQNETNLRSMEISNPHEVWSCSCEEHSQPHTSDRDSSPCRRTSVITVRSDPYTSPVCSGHSSAPSHCSSPSHSMCCTLESRLESSPMTNVSL